MNQIQQKINYFKFIDKIIDMLLIIFAIFLSIISENIFHKNDWFIYNQESFQPIAFIVTVIACITTIFYNERYFIYRLTTYKKIIINVLIISLFSLLFLIFIDFIFKAKLFFRTTILFYSMFLFILLCSKRIFYKIFLSSIRSKGKDVKNILIIGVNKITNTFVEKIQNHTEFGFNISAIIYEGNINFNNRYDINLVNIDDIDNLLLNESIDEVFIVHIKNRSIAINIIDKLENMGLNYHLIIDSDKFRISESSNITPKIGTQYEIPTISFYSVNVTFYKLVIKNFIERIAAFIIFLMTFPIILFSMILIKLTSKGPAIFMQERVGLRNRRFTQYKLRTMINDAEKRKKQLMHLNEQKGAVFKLSNDPRITFIGKFLRKYSIDELLQLINVLKGDMNLIGPRPPIPSEVEKYKIHHYRRFSFKPGITGLWQISGRNKIKNFDDWVKLDLQYIDNWSLTQDLIIALKTIPVIIMGSGK